MAVVLTLGCSASERGEIADQAVDGGARGAGTSSDAGADRLAWSPCTETELADAECATLEVPLDHLDPEGETIDIALSRLPAAEPSRRIGVLLLNAGGPGALGRPVPQQWRQDLLDHGFPEIPARFDLIGFDPRGVGASTRVDCGEVAAYGDVDWTPDDDLERDALERTMRDLAGACEARSGPLLEFIDTYSVARDMDHIRNALGEDEISYWGLSYGTALGTAYADLYPERVRAAVLEAAVRPDLDAGAAVREGAENWEAAFEAFAADCDARPDCAARFGGDFAGSFDRAVERIAAEPIVGATSGYSMNESWLANPVADALGGLPAMSSAIELFVEWAAAGNAGVAELVPRPNPIVPFLCADLGFTDPDAVYTELLPELAAAYPRFGHANLSWYLPCAHWSRAPRPHPSPRASGAAPILVVGGKDDATTPYWWSEELAAQLESGVLLTREGVGHVRRVPCVEEAVTAYLVDSTLPVDGTVCPAP